MGMKCPSGGSPVGRKQKPSLMPTEALPLTNLHPQNIRVRDWMRDSDFEKFGKRLRTVEKTGSGRGRHLCPEEDSDPTEVTVRYQNRHGLFWLI